MKGLKIRLSRKLVVVLGGVILLGGGSGAVALYIGADTILGPPYEEINGLECTTLQLVKIKRDHRYWVRKYVFTQGGDGPARLKTALRVAKAVQEGEKADLVQVTVLDKAGPTQRAAMRGRAIGAQVVYIPDLSKAPDPSDITYSAFYVDGHATANGEFFGTRIDPPPEEVERLSAALTDRADCVSPVTEDAGDAHGAGKGKKNDAHGGGHGAADSHAGEAGEAKKTGDGHGEAGGDHAPAAGGEHGSEPAAKAPEGEVEDGGLLGSLTSMIFGAEKKEDGHAGGDGAPAPAPEAAGANAPPQAEPPGLFARVTSMVFGSEETAVLAQPAAKPVATEPHGPGQDGIDPIKVAAPSQEKPAPGPKPDQQAAPSKAEQVAH
ncbi:hypothetical protein [Rhizobium sp. CSW-27]|uniref:hypothetical protein n=1 Tax=Rhizobium sp. CSW-27 TaxID=2839985 RepID=UPI001C031956|nr:hypothetical protein [Rhizobium sp. CSW-27]MBT9369185.1 hypothetical protein [Rhizobium sp. CSW-27]